jgi:hypothetical protein
MSSGGCDIPIIGGNRKNMSIQLTDDDLGKKFRTRAGDIVTLVRTPDVYPHRHVLTTHPYAYLLRTSTRYETVTVRRDGGWLFEEDDERGYDIIDRVNEPAEHVPCGGPIPGGERDNTCSQAPQNKGIPLSPWHTDHAPPPSEFNPKLFVTKDSGERQMFSSGMVRDTTAGKIDWHRVADGPMLKRWAELLTRGAEKYPDVEPGMPNWMLARGKEELARFRASAYRHFMQWYYHHEDEDHAAAVMFNINGFEQTKKQLDNPYPEVAA